MPIYCYELYFIKKNCPLIVIAASTQCICMFRDLFQAASYGKKNGIWYAPPGGQGWSKATSRKASIVETDAPPPGGGTVKPSSGRVIRIINNMDHTVQVSRINTFLTQLGEPVKL